MWDGAHIVADAVLNLFESLELFYKPLSASSVSSGSGRLV